MYDLELSIVRNVASYFYMKVYNLPQHKRFAFLFGQVSLWELFPACSLLAVNSNLFFYPPVVLTGFALAKGPVHCIQFHGATFMRSSHLEAVILMEKYRPVYNSTLCVRVWGRGCVEEGWRIMRADSFKSAFLYAHCGLWPTLSCPSCPTPDT